jgi:hypothetical protein
LYYGDKIITCLNQDDLKLNGTRPLLVYADDITILEGSVYATKENAEE